MTVADSSYTQAQPEKVAYLPALDESLRDGLSDQVDSASGLPILALPRDGLPALVNSPESLASCIDSLAGGTGPVAIDTERAQSFRYTARAYLLQFRRNGSGTWLIDPQAFEPDDGGLADLSSLGSAIQDAEWIVHAATQDLPCLVELGLRPSRLFDTELAGRILGLPRVNLGTMTEKYFGIHLLKEHSAADWSTRPLPEDWIAYAALDVELLIELRELMESDLEAAGKLDWAQQEFAHLITVYRHPLPVAAEPWRRTNGLHQVRSRRGLALARAMWQRRDAIARTLDKAPGRILQDKALSEFAALVPKDCDNSKNPAPLMPTAQQMNQIMGFKRRYARRYRNEWFAARQEASHLPPEQLPPLRVKHDGPPAQPHSWQRAHQDAWNRWQIVRPAVNTFAEELKLPPENLISPEALRWLAWEPLAEATEDAVRGKLTTHDVRPWQQDLLAPRLADLLAAQSHSEEQ